MLHNRYSSGQLSEHNCMYWTPEIRTIMTFFLTLLDAFINLHFLLMKIKILQNIIIYWVSPERERSSFAAVRARFVARRFRFVENGIFQSAFDDGQYRVKFFECQAILGCPPKKLKICLSAQRNKGYHAAKWWSSVPINHLSKFPGGEHFWIFGYFYYFRKVA